MTNVSNSQLGKKSEYQTTYNPSLLFPIARKNKRDEIGVNDTNPAFHGYDLWNHYEMSWLNNKGKPEVACGEIIYSCRTPNIIESKSMKLYFNSFNNTKFENIQQLEKIVIKDLSDAVGADVQFRIIKLEAADCQIYRAFDGICLDKLDIECDVYLPHPDYLTTNNEIVQEELYSDLLKSNCLVTNQPDWGSLYIKYTGKQIDHSGLLKYIISLRDHNEFHEQCVERIFTEILSRCKPSELTVYARYTRRGGLDINPYRTTNECATPISNGRMIRQ